MYKPGETLKGLSRNGGEGQRYEVSTRKPFWIAGSGLGLAMR